MRPLELLDCPFYLITRASLVVTAQLKSALSAAGIGQVRPSYLPVMMSLWESDGLKVIELGQRAGLEPSTMTGLLDRMERDGFLSRAPDPDDRRAQRVRLTDQGRSVRPAVEQIVDEALETVLARVSPTEQDRLVKTLRAILASTDRGGAL